LLRSVTATGARGSGQTGDADALGVLVPLDDVLSEGDGVDVAVML
jgi:hypothetical protein